MHAALSNVVALRGILILFWAANLGVAALGLSGEDVCLLGDATTGCSQLQVSAKVPGHQLARAAVSPLFKTARASVPNASFVEIEGALAVRSGAQLAESFLRGAARVELALTTLHKRLNPATQELSNAVSKLVEDQGASPVGCKSRLNQAKLKLKDIVETLTSTASILSTTKKEVQVVDTQLKQTLVSIKGADEEKTKGLEKCAEKKATDKMMLDMLMGDMEAMRSMKKTVQIPTARRTVQRVPSLLETGARLPATSGSETLSVSPDHADVQKKIGNAKAASLEMHNCLKQHVSASLLEHGTTPIDFDDLSDALRDDDGDDEAGGAQTAVTSGKPTKVALATSKMSAPQPLVNPPPPSQPVQPVVATTQPVVATTQPVQPAVVSAPPPQPVVATTQPVVATTPVVGPAPRPLPQVQPEPLIDETIPTLATEPDHCKTERETLKETWVVAYEELTREVESYEILVDDTSCVDAAEAEYEERFQPMQQTEKELSHKVSVAVSKVQTLRPQLQSLRSARKELEKRFEVITQECEALDKTKETLEVTKEVIVEMDKCAGLDASAFTLPVWVGQWITIELGEDLSIVDADAKMNEACAASFGAASRAAEVSEIDTGSVRRMPRRNDASLPMMPTCPMCGTQLARVCWDSGAKLNHRKRRTDCTPGARAVLCVNPDDSQ